MTALLQLLTVAVLLLLNAIFGVCALALCFSCNVGSAKRQGRRNPTCNQRATNRHPTALPAQDNRRQWLTESDSEDSAEGVTASARCKAEDSS